MNQMKKSVWVIFWILVAVFILSILTMFTPVLRLPFSLNVFAAWPVILGLGVALIVLTVRSKVPGKLNKFLLLTGASAVGLPVFAVLHNAVSALFNLEEAVFFTLATIVCPLGFLVGAVGTIILSIRNRPTIRTTEGGNP